LAPSDAPSRQRGPRRAVPAQRGDARPTAPPDSDTALTAAFAAVDGAKATGSRREVVTFA